MSKEEKGAEHRKSFYQVNICRIIWRNIDTTDKADSDEDVRSYRKSIYQDLICVLSVQSFERKYGMKSLQIIVCNIQFLTV